MSSSARWTPFQESIDQDQVAAVGGQGQKSLTASLFVSRCRPQLVVVAGFRAGKTLNGIPRQMPADRWRR